jgi:hypothetical protein
MSKHLALLAVLLIAAPLRADFASIAEAIDAQPGVHRITIPFLGFARAAVWMVHPKGVHDFQLVNFEGAEHLDINALQAMMRREIPRGFTPLVRVHSKRNGEWNFIYARPVAHTDRIELIILSHDHEDTVLVRVDVDATMVAKEIRVEPTHVASLGQ